MSWSAPQFNGGSAVIDYQISSDLASGNNFVVIASGVTSFNYNATSLTEGSTYQFKVEARNVYGLSAFSNTVSILAAQVPNKPFPAPTTTWVPDNVIVNWYIPDSGGSPITGFNVLLRKSDNVTFSTDLTDCDVTSSPSATSCTIPV